MDVVGPALAGVGNVPVQAALRPIRESATSGRFVFLPTPKSDFCHPSGVGESRSGLRDLRLTTLAVASADAQALAAQSCNGQHRASLDRFGLSPKVGFGPALGRLCVAGSRLRTATRQDHRSLRNQADLGSRGRGFVYLCAAPIRRDSILSSRRV
jgi:hypothetical protein